MVSVAQLASVALLVVAILAAPTLVRGETRTRRPIVDTHIHLYQVTRPGGVPWPEARQKPLYRDVLPAEYKALAKKHGISASGIVEASPLHEDNLRLLELVRGDRFFPFLVAQIQIGAPDFAQKLEALTKDPRVVGVRAFLWAPQMTLDGTQLAHVRLLAARGLTLDLVSRGELNPKETISALATAVPELRIVIDHLGGAKGAAPDPAWELAMRRLADRHANVYVKFSSFFDMYQPATGEEVPWKAPVELGAYKAHFDVLMSAFGPDRLIWGSNWPVSELGGDLGTQLRLAEEYLAPFGPVVRDKVMAKNALRVYRRAKKR